MTKLVPELVNKPDFLRTVERFEAWWKGEVLDRPPVWLWAKPARPYRGPTASHRTERERWLDVEFQIASAIARVEQQDFIGDSFPFLWPNIGPEITATLFGCELEFSETTSWSHPVVDSVEDWERIIAMPPDFNNPYWQAMERMTDHAIAACQHRYIVGMTDLHGNYDILAGLRDPQKLCMDLIDCPELLRRAGHHAAQAFVAAFNRSYTRVSSAGFGSTCWTQAYHAGPYYVPSCDFWCMVSPQIARDMILPDILTEMQPLDRSIFHLDGPQALPHLDLLLEIPRLNAVQWQYGAGHGPAARWLDVYRRILQAGKSLQILAETATDALEVLRALGPKGLWLTVHEQFDSLAEANAFLREVERIRVP